MATLQLFIKGMKNIFQGIQRVSFIRDFGGKVSLINNKSKVLID